MLDLTNTKTRVMGTTRITFEKRVKRILHKAKAKVKTKRKATRRGRQPRKLTKSYMTMVHIRNITICVVVLFILALASMMMGISSY